MGMKCFIITKLVLIHIRGIGLRNLGREGVGPGGKGAGKE